MKKVFAIAVLALLATACSKKETATESNVMLEEPEVTTVDSAATAKPADQATAATPATGDSAATKGDSAATK